MNRVILAGRLGADPELKTTNSGMTVANLRIATRERRKERGEWTDATEWHSVVCFGKTAELAGDWLEKGRECIIEGKIKTSQWETDKGERRYKTEILADRLEFVGGRASAERRKPAPIGHAEAHQISDDEIPF